jgi:hypothetical protein
MLTRNVYAYELPFLGQNKIHSDLKMALFFSLKYRSKVKHGYILRFLGYDFLYPGNTNFCSKTKSIEVIYH